MSYNGWKNYETWVTILWLSNEPGLEEEARRLAQSMETDQPPYNDRRDCEEVMREYVEMIVFDGLEPAGLRQDLLGHAMQSVDWYEVWEAFAEE